MSYHEVKRAVDEFPFPPGVEVVRGYDGLALREGPWGIEIRLRRVAEGLQDLYAAAIMTHEDMNLFGDHVGDLARSYLRQMVAGLVSEPKPRIGMVVEVAGQSYRVVKIDEVDNRITLELLS